MRIPKSFYLQGKKWTVKHVTQLTYKKEKVNGLTAASERTVSLRKGLEKNHKRWVFWHEYCHAMLYEACLTVNTGGLSDIVEEIICDNFAHAMVDKEIKFEKVKRK